MRKAALHNLGCKVNSYETEAMTQLLKKAGYEIVSFQDQADVYIINHALLQIWQTENQDRCFIRLRSKILMQ